MWFETWLTPGTTAVAGGTENQLWLLCLAGDPDRHCCSDLLSQWFCAPAPRGPLHRRRGPFSDRGHTGGWDRK